MALLGKVLCLPKAVASKSARALQQCNSLGVGVWGLGFRGLGFGFEGLGFGVRDRHVSPELGSGKFPKLSNRTGPAWFRV